MLVNYTYENMLNKVKLISISTSTLSSMRTKFGHIWVLSGWAYIKNWVDTQRDCIAFRPSRMRDHRLACETIASRRVPSSSRDGLSRIRAIYISGQNFETYIARMRDGFSLQCIWMCIYAGVSLKRHYLIEIRYLLLVFACNRQKKR